MSISSSNYYPFIKVLFDSLKIYHPEADLYWCLADKIPVEIDLAIEGVNIISAENLNICNFADFAFRYDILEFNTAVKPFMMQLLIEEYDYQEVVYLDPDIEVFAPLTPVFSALGKGADFAITPHITKPAEGDFIPDDIAIMRAGIYNLGFMAVANTCEVINFLHWWGRRLRFQCISAPHQGIFVDQKFIDLLPAFCDNVAILKNTNLNIAYWNLQQRQLTQNNENWLVDNQPLIFFHFSGINPKNKQRLSKYTESFNGDLDLALQNIIEHYLVQVKNNKINSLIKPKCYYNYFKNGVLIPKWLRIAYRNLEDTWFKNPFRELPNYLNKIHGLYGSFLNFPLTNVAVLLWNFRLDLKNAFDLSREENRKQYLLYLLDHQEELELEPFFIKPILDIVSKNIKSKIQRPSPQEKYQEDITIIGYLKAEMGVGHAGRMVAESLATTDYQIAGFNVTKNVLARQEETRLKDLIKPQINGKIHIYNINADQLQIVKNELKNYHNNPAYIINMPFWELSQVPSVWQSHYQDIDEIWAPSGFVQNAFARAFPDIPVLWMPPAVAIPASLNFDRSYFQLPENCFLFHFSFDLSSFASRKNPYGAIEAYNTAFKSKSEYQTALIIKTMGNDPTGENLAKLEAITAEYQDIIIINQQMTHPEALGLMNCCDCYISLHRSEGFGYTLAEAMLMSKPVIATNYSATTDFLNADTGFPVDYRLIPLAENEYPSALGQVWAEADLDHSAWLMRKIINNPDQVESTAQRGKEKITSLYSPAVVGKRMKQRLEFLGFYPRF